MFAPGLADLLEALVVTRIATHSVNILWNKRMVVARQGKPIHVYRPFVARIGTQSEAYAVPDGTSLGLHQADQLAHDDIWARDSSNARLVQCGQYRGFHIAVLVELCDLDGSHVCADGDSSNCDASVCRIAKGGGEFFREPQPSAHPEQLRPRVVVILVS